MSAVGTWSDSFGGIFFFFHGKIFMLMIFCCDET